MEIILGALAYIIPTMPYAYFWHMVWFKDKYEKWEYFGKNPSIPFGFGSMIIQGIVLSVAYFSLPIDTTSLTNALVYSAVMGIFFWSTHVVSAMAKHHECRNSGYFLLETVYLVGQFGLFAFLLHFVSLI